MSSRANFQCQNPDFVVRSIHDDTQFPVQRAALRTSEVFRDMFALCEEDGNKILDLQESTGALNALLRLLHDPPTLPVQLITDEEQKFRTQLPKTRYDPKTVIPLPLLISVLFGLVDKYALPDSVAEILRVHLIAHAPRYPLEVYGFATLNSMEKVASEASQYLVSMSSYSLEEIKAIPDVVAYHKVIQLQAFRVNALQKLLLEEDIFPHGYGECTTHRKTTPAAWDMRRKALIGKIETGTDVAGEMETLADELRDCVVCHRACVAAVEMLAYKCRKVPRKIHQLF